MNKTYFYILTTFLLVGAFANVAKAQTETCAVKIIVKSEEGILVKDATATATSYETKKLYNAALTEGMPFFPELKRGGYEFSITKAGFKQSVGDIYVGCKSESDILEAKVSKGDGKETFDITVRSKVRDLTAEEKELVKRLSTTTDATERLKLSAKLKGILNFDAIYLAKPKYPSEAKAAKASGVVTVQITVNEKGEVESAEAIEGHSLLREAAVAAAKKAKFNPMLKDGKPVKFSGKLVYSFVM
jgi:TonB family protein